MEDQEKPFQDPDPEREWLERREQEHRKSLEAAELLYQMSLNGEYDEDKIKQLCKTISWGHLHEHLVGKEDEYSLGWKATPDFFDTLPVLNKIARIYENFRAGEQSFFNRDLRDLSNDARFMLYHGLLAVDQEALAQFDEQKTKDFFESLKLILTSEYDYAIEEAVNFLNKHKDLFIQLSETKQLSDIQNKAEELQNFLKTREFERALVNAVQEGINARRRPGKQKVEIEYCEGLLRKVLIKYGFNPDEILDVWNGSYTEHSPQPQIRSNMDKVFNMEDKREGIARLLYREFGIRNFERYPESILIAQFDEFEYTDKPYGVMIQATHDWNGAFGVWSNMEIWEKLFKKIKERYAFRVVEARSKLEVARRLIRLKKKYGGHNQISFAFIGGHGSKDSITFGGPHRRNMLLLEDLAGRGVQRTGGFFEPHPTIVLVSCSTGAEGGIGQKLSKTLGAKVIAPSVSTSLKSIEAILTDEGIDFKVEYKTEYQGQDIGKVYSAGENIENI